MSNAIFNKETDIGDLVLYSHVTNAKHKQGEGCRWRLVRGICVPGAGHTAVKWRL